MWDRASTSDLIDWLKTLDVAVELPILAALDACKASGFSSAALDAVSTRAAGDGSVKECLTAAREAEGFDSGLCWSVAQLAMRNARYTKQAKVALTTMKYFVELQPEWLRAHIPWELVQVGQGQCPYCTEKLLTSVRSRICASCNELWASGKVKIEVDDDLLVAASAVSKHLGIGKTTLYRWRENSDIPVYSAVNNIYAFASELDAWSRSRG